MTGFAGDCRGVFRRAAISTVALMLGAGAVLAESRAQSVSISERARGASRVVVATVADTTARYERNEFGDELIVTHAVLSVEEAIKGDASPAALAIEGGTIDGVTLRVSSLPTLSSGERAVFFLTPGRNGEFRPHLRGQGILKLDAENRVRGTTLTLDEIREQARPYGR